MGDGAMQTGKPGASAGLPRGRSCEPLASPAEVPGLTVSFDRGLP